MWKFKLTALMWKAESFDMHTQTTVKTPVLNLKLHIYSYICVKWHSHKLNDRHTCVRRIYFCTSVSLYNHRSALTSSQILQFNLKSQCFDFCYSFHDIPVANSLVHLYIQKWESRTRGGAGVRIKPFYFLMPLANDQGQPTRLALWKETFLCTCISYL